MAQRKKPTTRTKVKSVLSDDYTLLEKYCISLNEYYKALRVAGFPVDISISMIQDKASYPDWIIPDLPNKINPLKYVDDDEDED
jgi:hypothetical protein